MSVRHDRWARAILRERERVMGRRCFLLDSAQLAEEVAVIVYQPEETEVDGQLRVETRVAVYANSDLLLDAGVTVAERDIAELIKLHGGDHRARIDRT